MKQNGNMESADWETGVELGSNQATLNLSRDLKLTRKSQILVSVDLLKPLCHTERSSSDGPTPHRSTSMILQIKPEEVKTKDESSFPLAFSPSGVARENYVPPSNYVLWSSSGPAPPTSSSV